MADISDNLLIGKANSFVDAHSIVSDPKSIGDVMVNVAIRITNRVLAQVDSQKVIDTGLLRQSVSMPVQLMGQEFVAQLKMIDYYDQVNLGVNGTLGGMDTPYKFGLNVPRPSIESLQGWADRHRIPVFALRKSLLKKGQRGNLFFKRAMSDITNGEINTRFINEMKKVGTKNIVKSLNQLFEESGATVKSN